ncbi:MAG: lamin tail domain-containing protein [Pseudobacter sp.]|uniref:lamin tail domain-containing protein n=1 Tax=Pseudobacter sp. TaxID=2045420 RepID=UPI003F813128
MRISFLLLPLCAFLFPALHFLPFYKLFYDEEHPASHLLISYPDAVIRKQFTAFKKPLPVPRYDLIITEIMADPSPPAGLPEYEYVEIMNRSGRPIDLKGYSIGDETGAATFTASVILQPDSFLVCCSGTAAAKLQPFGRAIGLANFPSLANESDLVQLCTPDKRVLHAIRYEAGWFGGSPKAAGGYSLEMINTNTPCAGTANWAASTAIAGGTPGKTNSHPPGHPDNQPPALLRTYASGNKMILAVFDEPMDSNSVVQPNNYIVQPGNIRPVSCLSVPPFYNEVQLQFADIFPVDAVYQLTTTNLKDCATNSTMIMNNAKLGLPSLVKPGDIIINELLFDPPPEGADYLELFNRSDRIIDLRELFTSNRNAAGQLVNTKALSLSSFLLFPGQYLAISENTDWVKRAYTIMDGLSLLNSGLPSLPNDQGSLVLTNAAGQVIDELHYKSDWHFSLLVIPEGIALERIGPWSPTQDRNNWTSAATTAGGGTPGYANSQFKGGIDERAGLHLSSSLFSPDLDGHEDLLLIHYKLPYAGAAGTVNIFDIAGRPVKQLASNAIMGTTGHWSWDGMNDAKRAVPAGMYIVHVSWFTAQGLTKKWKQGVALIRK